MAKRSKRKKVVGDEGTAKVADAGTITQQMPSWFRRDWVLGLILVLAVILTYQPVWYAGFIWDDNTHVTANPCIIGPLGLKEIWTTSAGQFFPLVLTTFWVEHALWGLEPLPYHLINVFQHAAGAILLWRILRSLHVPGAWLGAALWALHPLQVESVAWISEMKNTQSCLFYLLTILFFVRCLRARGINKVGDGGWNYALTLIFAALAMASKSSTVVLPVVLALCAWWVEGRWHGRNLMRLIPISLMSVVASAITIWPRTPDVVAIGDQQWVRTWPERFITAGDAVWFYLGKLIWPYPLITIYPRWKIDAGEGLSYLPLLAVIIVLFILWLKRETWSRPYFFALSYFLVVLSPFLGLIDQSFWRHSFVEDHLQYLAGMGPLALVGAGLARFSDFGLIGLRVAVLGQGEKRLAPSLRPVGVGIVALVMILLTWQSHGYAGLYINQETLWTYTLQRNPQAYVAHNNLGAGLLLTGRVAEAMEYFKQALRINPDYTEAHDNMGIALTQVGQVPEAMEQYEQALRLKPDDVVAHDNLGLLLGQSGRINEAMEQFEQVLRFKPDDEAAHSNLGLCLQKSGRVEEAIKQYQEALRLKPDNIVAHDNLGLLLGQSGRINEAMEQFEQALRLKPDDEGAHCNLGLCLQKSGRVSEAIEQYQEALQFKPDDAAARSNLAYAQTLQKTAPAKK